MKFICLGYFDEAQWMKLPEEVQQRLMDECFEYDDVLRHGGHFIGGEALGPSTEAVTVRMRNGSVAVTDGPYAETKEVLGGIMLMEARDLNHAISLMSQHPGVKAGPFEIRAADATVNALIKERDRAMGRKQALSAEDEIRALLSEWAANTQASNNDAILSRHTPDALFFDVLPPLKHEGAAAYRATWDAWQPKHVTDAVFALSELQITAGDAVAYATAMIHCAGKTPGGSYDEMVRATFCLRRVEGLWQIAHQHISAPVSNT